MILWEGLYYKHFKNYKIVEYFFNLYSKFTDNDNRNKM